MVYIKISKFNDFFFALTFLSPSSLPSLLCILIIIITYIIFINNILNIHNTLINSAITTYVPLDRLVVFEVIVIKMTSIDLHQQNKGDK